MTKHYIYNCLIKNDVNLLWLATLFSVFHCLYFYNQESTFAIVVISIATLLSTIALIFSFRLRVIINIRQNMSLLVLGGVFLVLISALQYQTNDISSFFISLLSIVGITLSVINIKEFVYISKLEGLPSSDKTTLAECSVDEVIALYKMKIYEIVRKHNDELDRKYSLFFDYRLNMIVDKYDMTSLDDERLYKLHDFANHCKENDVSLSKRTKEDFEVFKMMII